MLEEKYFDDNSEQEVKVLPELNTDKDAERKLLTLVRVLFKSLIPCLVATPLVYLNDQAWLLSSHSVFRSTKRTKLERLMKSLNSVSKDSLRILADFEQILLEVLSIRIPAMLEFYEQDQDRRRVAVKVVCHELCTRVKDGKSLAFRARVRNLGNVLLRWFTYQPVGRPHLYLSDADWELIPEKNLRASYRHEIAND